MSYDDKDWKSKWYQENKQKHDDKTRLWRINNREKYQKNSRIYKWKQRGLLLRDDETYDIIYEKFINTTHCELCNVELSKEKKRSKTTKCMDHCHETGFIRNILCHSCNTNR